MAVASEQAYEAIRQGIASGVYASGSHLRAADLAEDLGISRTPVREALRRLSSEGLVNFFPNRGAYVTDWSRDDAEEVFAMRTVLESYAAELSAVRLTPAQIDDLSRCTQRMEQAAGGAGARDLDALARHNSEFHSLIISAAANRRLAALIASVVERALVTRTFSIYSDEDLARSLAHHRDLIAAFRARDGVWAGSVMRSHIRAAHHVFLAAADHDLTHEGKPAHLAAPAKPAKIR
jgi:DNA-binding GntR family transcriptional regulator